MSSKSYMPVFAILLLFPVSLVLAQEKRVAVDFANQNRLTVTPHWKVSSKTKTSVELFIPAERDRQPPAPPLDMNPKPLQLIGGEAVMLIVTEPRRNHAEAVRRLEEIAAQRPEDGRKLIIDGWPAIERRYPAPLPVMGDSHERSGTPVTTV